MDDSTAVWPDDRPTVELGVLSVTKAADNDAAQRALGYDPLQLVDGIEASDDPLLEFRSAVYAGLAAPPAVSDPRRTHSYGSGP